jgi:hypothetical protein
LAIFFDFKIGALVEARSFATKDEGSVLRFALISKLER